MRDLSMLQMVNLAYGGGEATQRRENDLINEYCALEGIDRKREEIEANWQALKLKGRD